MKVQTSSSSVEKSDAKRWLVIGAYQTGANVKKISRLCGLNQSAVRRIILNFKRTGSPHMPRGLSSQEKLKPFVEYDEQGNLIDSEEDTPIQPQTLKEKIRARRPSAKDLIAYVLSKAQQQAETTEPVLFSPQKQDTLNNKWRPPTPPRDPVHQEEAQNTHQQHRRSILSPPLSEPSISPKPNYDDTVIRGYETWTMDEDKILMAHVLARLHGGRWEEASHKLKGKHSPDVCQKRWEVLRNLLIHGANKSSTRGW